MTSLLRRLFCACILVAVVAGLQPSPARSAPPLCGNRWVNTTYVVPANCMKACLNSHHTMADCKTTLEPLCQGCWLRLTVCAGNKTIPAAVHCQECTDVYASCMKPFF